MLVSLYFFKIKFVQNNSFGYPCYLLNYRIFALALPGPQSSQFRKKKGLDYSASPRFSATAANSPAKD